MSSFFWKRNIYLHTIPLEMWGQDYRPSQPFRKVLELRGATLEVRPKHPPPVAVLFRVAVTAESFKSRAGDLDRATVGGLWAGCIMAPVHGYSAKKLEIRSQEIKAATSTHKGRKNSRRAGQWAAPSTVSWGFGKTS